MAVEERCAQEFKVLLAEVITVEACSRETEDGKTVSNSWSTAKQLLKGDLRYSKMARKDRETLWRRYVEDIHRRQKSTLDEVDKARSKGSSDSRRRVFLFFLLFLFLFISLFLFLFFFFLLFFWRITRHRRWQGSFHGTELRKDIWSSSRLGSFPFLPINMFHQNA
ncbi:hypothetical protein H5410_019885 [Solanum commersonii]|uniref:Uncharacterized protein n=1 Tax=Solanum commersonii TaxID=4109 RepID=A0A9J5ZAW1_SOLCO|nr:hypothetical protein H5410_019885 [Solanum commersonii]